VSVTEPSDAPNAGMSKQMEGCKLVLSCKSLPSVSCLVGWWVEGLFLSCSAAMGGRVVVIM